MSQTIPTNPPLDKNDPFVQIIVSIDHVVTAKNTLLEYALDWWRVNPIDVDVATWSNAGKFVSVHRNDDGTVCAIGNTAVDVADLRQIPAKSVEEMPPFTYRESVRIDLSSEGKKALRDLGHAIADYIG